MLDDFRMSSMKPDFQQCIFSGVNDFLFQFFAHFFHNFFDASRMDAPVGDQPFKSQTCNFPAERIES